MAIVNVTPDSFADGGLRLDPDRAADDARRMAADGADLIDIGGESTRPGAEPLPEDEEWRRVGPVLERLSGRIDVPLSIDTYKAGVARRALDLGASMINDISGLASDPALARVAAERGAALVLMHHRGRSADMYARAEYGDVAAEIAAELRGSVEAARAAGVPADRIVVDPGLGFAKRAEHSLQAIAALPAIAALGFPVLVGPSRKSFLASAPGPAPPAGRVWGTAAAVTAAILFGAHVVRVHDVAEMVQVARVADAIRSAADRPSP